MHFPCIGTATIRSIEKKRTKNRMCLNVITICGKFKFIAIQCSALSRAQRTHNSKCKRSRRHKWVCGDGKRLFALCGGCVLLVNALLLSVTFRRCFENSQRKRDTFRFYTLDLYSFFSSFARVTPSSPGYFSIFCNMTAH